MKYSKLLSNRTDVDQIFHPENQLTKWSSRTKKNIFKCFLKLNVLTAFSGSLIKNRPWNVMSQSYLRLVSCGVHSLKLGDNIPLVLVLFFFILVMVSIKVTSTESKKIRRPARNIQKKKPTTTTNVQSEHVQIEEFSVDCNRSPPIVKINKKDSRNSFQLWYNHVIWYLHNKTITWTKYFSLGHLQ